MDDSEQPMSEADRAIANRRRVLKLGAIGAVAVVTVRPALAQAAGSVLNCKIPVPDGANAGKNIAADGRLVAPTTPGSFPGAGREYTGEQVKRALRGGQLPGTSYEQSDAYVRYIKRLQSGQSGFTCYASLVAQR